MRVLHWYPGFLAGGGVANSVLALANAQADLGLEVGVVSLDHEAPIYGPLALDDRVRLITWRGEHALRVGPLRLHMLDRRDRRRLRALPAEVVHLHAEFSPDNWWVPRLWQAPLVLSPHGAFHHAVLNRGARSKRAYLVLARRRLYRHLARIHALSPAEAAAVLEALPAAEAYCAPQGPSPAVRAIAGACRNDDARLSAPSRQGPVRLLFVGRIDVAAKGLDLLIEAFAGSLHHPGATPARATLTLVGPDWNDGARTLRTLAARLGVGNLVEIRDRVPATDVPVLLEACDIYVQLSRNESSPLSLNDALVLGKPAIVSDRVGTVSSPEIASLPHVVVVPPAIPAASQAIRNAIRDLSELAAAARAQHSRVGEFLSWERAATCHEAVYRSLAAPPASVRPVGKVPA